MAAAKAPDFGCTGAEYFLGVLDFFFSDAFVVEGMGSNKELAEEEESKVVPDPLLVISELDRTGSAEATDRMMVF